MNSFNGHAIIRDKNRYATLKKTTIEKYYKEKNGIEE
jgi:hypothetical protein